MSKDAFWQRMADESPCLRVQFGDEVPRIVDVWHTLYSQPGAMNEAAPGGWRAQAAGTEIEAFYSRHDGLDFCSTFDVRYDQVLPLVAFVPAARIAELTARYQPGGDRAWAIDFNKSRTLYRGDYSHSWIVFAEVGDGPAALVLLLDGEHAGHVFFVTPQPRFNILRPVARGFDALLQRMGKDPAAFLRLVGAHVCLPGDEKMRQDFPPDLPNHFGFKPLEYRADRATWQGVPG
jgi:hypothetical protein